MTRRIVVALSAIIVASCLTACGDNKGTPTSPTAPTVATKIIAVSGDLSFGNVDLGSSADRTFTINNSGNATLTVSALNVPSGMGSVLSASWTSGTVAAGATQSVTVRFTPAVAQYYAGVLTVAADHTSGNNAINFQGFGVDASPLWAVSGSGDNVFTMPSKVKKVKIVGDYSGYCQNFMVDVGGLNLVNEILGACSIAVGRHFEGTYLTGGGTVAITHSTGVSWSLTEVR